MPQLNSSPGMRATRLGFTLLVLVVLQGCANLTAVREFGKTAAEISSYGEAGKAYQMSARTREPYRTIAPVLGNQSEARQAQVAEATAIKGAIAAYFSTLAKLAGEDAFTLDRELDSISKGLQSLPAGAIDPDAAANAVALSKTISKYVLAKAQASAIQELVTEGGPTAMRLVTRLESLAMLWRSLIESDLSTISDSISNLGASKETHLLLSVLVRDRLAQHQQNYTQALQRIDMEVAALRKVRAGHETMVANLHSLDSNELQALLKDAVFDLKSAKKNLDALRLE